MHSNWEVIAYVLLGLLTGCVAPFFLQLLRRSGQFFACLPLPLYGRLALGGALVGALSLYEPQVWGNGASVVIGMLHVYRPWQVLLMLLLCKLLATAATVGSGAFGGVFTPTLFVGAVLGLLFENVYHAMVPLLSVDPSAYALVGMGSFLAATTHAPLMAIIMLFEMTLDYDLVLPLMLACVVAYYTAYGIDRRSIYQAVAAERPAAPALHTDPRVKLQAVCVADLLLPQPPTLLLTASFMEVVQLFARTPQQHIYIVDEQRRLCGMVALQDIRDYLEAVELAELVTAYDVMQASFPWLTPQMDLYSAAQQFSLYPQEHLPVVNNPEAALLVGSLAKTDLLLTLTHGAPTPAAVAA